MIYLVVGTPDSGKSKRAEEIAVGLSIEGPRYYVATMIPFGQSGEERIKKHRALREGKNFTTIECPFDVDKVEFEETNGTVLLECISNLVANELFERKSPSEDTVKMIIKQVRGLSLKARNTVVVTNRFPLMEEDYDQATITYVNTIDAVNRELIKLADKVEEIGHEHI